MTLLNDLRVCCGLIEDARARERAERLLWDDDVCAAVTQAESELKKLDAKIDKAREQERAVSAAMNKVIVEAEQSVIEAFQKWEAAKVRARGLHSSEGAKVQKASMVTADLERLKTRTENTLLELASLPRDWCGFEHSIPSMKRVVAESRARAELEAMLAAGKVPAMLEA